MPTHPDREVTLAKVLQAADEAASALPPADAERLRGFTRAVLGQVRTVQAMDASPAQLAARLKDTWSFLDSALAVGARVNVTASERGLVVQSAMVDQPFIVDTLRLGLRGRGASRISGFTAIIRVAAEGSAARVVGEGEGRAWSIVRFEVEGIDPATAADVQADLRGRLAVSRAMVEDFEVMMAKVEATALAAFDRGGDDGIEAAEFLRWLLSDNFVFVGITHGSETLGADKLGADHPWSSAPNDAFDGVISVTKDRAESPAHRAGRIDVVRVNVATGQVVIRGMFTHRALTQPCRHLPILRRTLAAVLAVTRQRPNSYRYRGLANIFDAMPTEWLFSATPEQIGDVLERVFDADQEQTARVHLTQRDDGASTFVLVALPERRYSDSVRARVLDYLNRITGASYCDSGLFAGRFDSVLIQVFLTGTKALDAEATARLEAFVTELTTPWAERVAPAIHARFGEAGGEIVARYADAFPAAYGESTSAAQSVRDILMLEESRRLGQVRAAVFEQHGDIVLRVYETQDVTLTELMPVIDNFGLLISDQWSTPVRARGVAPQDVDSFRVSGVTGIGREEILGRAAQLVDGIQAVFEKKIVSDPFNRLVLRANLRWDEVDLLRAYIGYAKQIGLKHSYPRIQEILLNQSAVVAAIVRLFHAKFDPDLAGDRAATIASALATAQDYLRGIKTADEDFVIRTLLNLVDASLRTNFYRTDRVAHYISFKVDHAKVWQMPVPRMMVEIYMHHREVEGVHLRGGPIARGGLRFSDRADFRTEILGLVTTQMVKNVVIVPEGSKGGFYIKYTIEDAAERKRKGDELYKFLIRGMLDLTDNIVAGKVVPPPRVVRHDGDDPYLVVAADKGTAHLSDTANSLSKAYGFWLGDAFASGGSNGYDHKVVGITARGGWVLVKRMFREMGLDADKDVFTCFGIGDCGGDVFGNGVIETRKMKLLAAFNHAHIFFDPDPDPETSYDERRRLFDIVGGWDKYNTALLSKGGGIYSRKDKSIPLSAEVKAMLGTNADELTPTQVMNLILKMQVDLFWNGGIGTYVRASFETNTDANDPPNDEVRISAPELRAKIVGEGGNLGFTQAARVEYAQLGGRLNTDFVDNSGGVDTSDHEVNIKILLNPMVAAGRFDEAKRNEIIHSMTDEVANAVLGDNNANGRLISLDVVRSARDPFPYGRAIDWICTKGNVTRRFLVLPSDNDLKNRASQRQGLVRPELAVLQAHVKMHVYKMLLGEDPSVIPNFDQLVLRYFPQRLRTEFPAEIPTHMLYKQIGMTVLLTEVCTDAGAAFFPLMLELTGASASRIAGAWRAAMDLLGGDALKEELQAAHANPHAAYSAWVQFTDALTQLVTHWLSPGSKGWEGEDPARFHEALKALVATRSGPDAEQVSSFVDSVVAKGIPRDIAQRIVDASYATAASEVASLAAERGEPVASTAQRLVAVGQASRLFPLLRQISLRKGEGRWDPVALGIQRVRYQALLHELVRQSPVAPLTKGHERDLSAVETEAVKAVAVVVERVVGDAPDVASLLVGEQRIRGILA